MPYLDELLEVPERRTRVFHRGYDVYDPTRLGFIAVGPDAERHGTRQDAGTPGNGNSGHLFGVDLPPGEKRALLEFLKTL